MSYCSENKLSLSTPVSRLIEVIELLGYKRIQTGYKRVSTALKTENEIAAFIWCGSDDAISYVGVELSIYKETDCISVQTRSRIGRSFWDLEQQNKTISLLKSLFHGSFSTDEGSNRYMKFDEPIPSRLACALYKARWIYHNVMLKPLVYLNSRNMMGDIAQKNLTGLQWIDEMNPRFLSNNMIVPYIIGCWEAYYRNSFVAILQYADNPSERALKNCRISNEDLLKALRNEGNLAFMLADKLSFQRPGIIAENYRALNSSIDIASWLRKPYHNRRITLFDSITELIDVRDRFVHTGVTTLDMSDKRIRRIIDDLNEAVDRVYDGFGNVYGFEPSHSF